MLEIDILLNKKIADNGSGVALDLIPSVLSKTKSPDFNSFVIVPQDGEMRADLIAHTSMGKQSSVGILLKTNGISNPFSIASGEILYIPSNNYMASAFSSVTTKDKTSQSKSFRKQLQDKISKVSDDRLEYLKSKNISDAVISNPLPPNVTDENENSVEFIDGKIVFGSNIGICRTKLNNNTSTTQLKSRLVQKKIFKGS